MLFNDVQCLSGLDGLAVSSLWHWWCPSQLAFFAVPPAWHCFDCLTQWVQPHRLHPAELENRWPHVPKFGGQHTLLHVCAVVNSWFGTHSNVEPLRSFTAGLLDIGACYIVTTEDLTTSDLRGQNSPPSRHGSPGITSTSLFSRRGCKTHGCICDALSSTWKLKNVTFLKLFHSFLAWAGSVEKSIEREKITKAIIEHTEH